MDQRHPNYQRRLKKKAPGWGRVVIGLTGSAAMGKSTLVKQLRTFQRQPIWDADFEVAKLYQHPAVLKDLARVLPTIFQQGIFNKEQLRRLIEREPNTLRTLEAIFYPYLQKSRWQHLLKMQRFGLRKIVLDIPLLYEKGWDKNCQQVVVVTCPSWLQQQRLLKRPGTTQKYADTLLAQQWPALEKCRRADSVIRTGIGRAFSARQLQELLLKFRETSNDGSIHS